MGDHKVLVVDDERPVRKLMAVLAAMDGYEVLQAKSGAEALEIAENKHFDLVVSDVMMPGMSGPELVTALRERGLVDHWLLVSGFAGDLGDCDVPLMAKPFTPQQFLGRIHEILAN